MMKKPASRRGRSSSAPPPAEPAAPETPVVLAAPDRLQRVQLEAYLIAERRGFAPGNELEDWLAAERIVDGRADVAG